MILMFNTLHEMTDSHAKRKTCNSLVTGQKNVGYLGDSDAHRDGSIDVTGQGLTTKKVPYFRAFRASDHQ